MQRALKYDGLLPQVLNVDAEGRRSAGQASLKDLRTFMPQVRAQRPAVSGYDVIVEGETPGDDPLAAAATLAAWRDAGATWWLETMWGATFNAAGTARMRRRIRQGPPAI